MCSKIKGQHILKLWIITCITGDYRNWNWLKLKYEANVVFSVLAVMVYEIIVIYINELTSNITNE